MTEEFIPPYPVRMTREETERILNELLHGIPPKPQQPNQRSPITLDNLVIEEKSPRDKKEKTLQSYDQSLISLRQRGFKRHLRPDEAFRILVDSIENKGKPLIKSLSEDMLSSYGEWLSLAIQRKGSQLTCYLDPENLAWNGSQYAVNGNSLRHSGEHKFNIHGIPSEQWVDLDKLPQDLVTFLYSRPYDKLPKIMKEGNKRSKLWLPPEGVIMPSGRGNGIYDFYVSGSYYSWASRGVRERR